VRVQFTHLPSFDLRIIINQEPKEIKSGSVQCSEKYERSSSALNFTSFSHTVTIWSNVLIDLFSKFDKKHIFTAVHKSCMILAMHGSF
jgi:hypothetical protein